MKTKNKFNQPVRSSGVPATAGMLYEMEERLVSKISSEINGVRSEIGGLKSDLNGLKADIDGLKSGMSGLKSELHRVALLVEEQNARNKYVMDGYMQLYDLFRRHLPLAEK